MLAKKYKLPIQDFIGKRGKLVKSPFFLVKIYSASENFSHFGVTVSSKVAKKASQRNKLRRLAYNFLKDYHKKMPLADYWISVQHPAAGLSRESFIKEFKKVLNG